MSAHNIRALRDRVLANPRPNDDLQKKNAGHQDAKEAAKHRVRWSDSAMAFKSRIRTGVITNRKHKDPSYFLEDCKSVFQRKIKNVLKEEEFLKVNVVFCGEFKAVKCERDVQELKYFSTCNSIIDRKANLKNWFHEHVTTYILTRLDEFEERDSGWSLAAILNLGVHINKFTPQLASSYIDLPPQIKIKKACINVKNKDDACFAWSIVSALCPAKRHSDRTRSYPRYSDILKLDNIKFPMALTQISKFEKLNKISVNVYELKKRCKVVPVHLTDNKFEKHVNLLLIQDKRYSKFHYVWIKDLSRLVSSQLSKHTAKKYFCDRCLRYFYTKNKLDTHSKDCNMNKCRDRLPTENQKDLKFKNFNNKEKVPFIIYADLECILVKEHSCKNTYQRHVPAAVGYYVKCSYDPDISFYKSYRGEECMSWFAKELGQFAEDVETAYLCPYDISLTPAQQSKFKKEKRCHICEKPFKSKERKVRDHCHLTPENNYRGAAHKACNINYKNRVVIPVVFHNLSGYDAHFILEKIANDIPGYINLLPITKEKYISFTKNIHGSRIKFRFIDSFRFLASSLDALSSYLTNFVNLKTVFSEFNEGKLDLLKKKGIYPYDFMDSFQKFDLERLPKQHEFHNRLEGKDISEEQYIHAQRVWKEFGIKNLGEYTDLYMKTDIILLADVFENFRSTCHETYGLDPAHYYTLPGYTWDCMLYKTRITLQLLTDGDQVTFVERGIRGGLSQCSKRKSVANNQYLQNFDPEEPSTYLVYFDINNQYGWAMSQFLPSGGFEWVVDPEIDITSIPDNSPTGYLLEVDLEYPQDLHDKHQDLPFCPEHRAPPGNKTKKLLATLYNKERYVIHYRSLKQALQHGLKLQKIHRVLKFNQSPWLKSYIDMNTQLRKNAKNEFEKNLFKLMNNAVFGKTIENVRKYSIVKLISKWEGRYGAEALISKPQFKSCTIFNENLVAIELEKTDVFLNKPIYVGMSILDIAKTTIYEFHYDYMEPEFHSDCSVLYTDTDSLIYEIKNKNIYKVIRRDCSARFDTSDYEANNRYKIPQVNKKVLGKMKDEFNGIPIELFIGLRSKMYAIKRAPNGDDESEDLPSTSPITKKVKGIKRCVTKGITLEDFLNCVDNLEEKPISQNIIRSKGHQVYSLSQEKIALSPHDDKRYLIKGSYKTLPWGHYNIENNDDLKWNRIDENIFF